ncbi:uridine kinase family protein [Nocardioides kribbensis]|uniref:uridine kinase family protein n=1 Tax=Nocardioides kribbensis TaxID=305517 RepID=UPI0029D414ED|nr:4-amino-4-deoxy-L-arabinose transferase [Nocardioides kribbensis]
MVLDLARERAPRLAGSRLVCLDGPAGSGKTTLALALADLATSAGLDAHVVHMDDLYDGWDGLPRVGEALAPLLGPLAAGAPGRYRRYDWHRAALAETVTVPPAPLLVLEGVGSGLAAWSHHQTLLVWVEAPSALRLARGLERDGADLADRWRAWRTAEDLHHTADRTRERADLVVDGTGRTPPGPPGEAP